MADPKTFNLKEIIPLLSLLIDYQAEGNLYHGLRVGALACNLSEKAYPNSKAIALYAGLLHDIGLFETGEHLVAKPRKLEIQKNTLIFRNHPSVGAGIVSQIPGLSQAVNPIRDHHEYYDGSGYPCGKTFGNISFLAQVLRVADSLDLFIRANDRLGAREIAMFLSGGAYREFCPDVGSLLLEIDGEIFAEILESNRLEGYFVWLNNGINYPIMDISASQSDIVLRILSRAIDGKHHYTNEHSYRVSSYSAIIASMLELNPGRVNKVKLAGYLHDIGKIAIPNSILDKPGKLSQKEWAIIKTHTSISYELVNSVSYFRDISEIVFSAQEEYDGSGYPKHLKGSGIPLEARIIAVADAIDAMLSDRAYRKALTVGQAITELKNNSGKQFDPEVVEHAVDLLEQGQIPVG